MLENRKTEMVCRELFEQMDLLVSSYGENAIRPVGRIDGTGFFPGGIGLWRGDLPHGTAPDIFPKNIVVFLGNNFGMVKDLDGCVHRGVERLNVGAWKYLLEYQQVAGISPCDSFYTNVFTGLHPNSKKSNSGRMEAGKVFEHQCRTFLVKQIEIVRPKLVVILGVPAREQWEQLTEVPCKSVAVIHPSGIWCNRSALQRVKAIEEQGTLIRSALS